MTRTQMHIFNWFFLGIMVALAIVHFLVADYQGVAVGMGLYIFLLVFAVIWFVIYCIQWRSFGTKRGQVSLVLNGFLTGFWVIIYTFINAA